MKRQFETSSPDVYLLLKGFARENRKHATDAEKVLWEYLREHKVLRQHIVGDYIVDFIFLNEKLVIEVDGGYHAEKQQIEYDELRTSWLQRHGFRVIRFTNEDILENTQRIVNIIMEEKKRIPTFPSSNAASAGNSHPASSGNAAPSLEGGRGESLCVDGACSGNPGPMEYRGVHLPSGKEVFRVGPMLGTNNIAEFLAIVHALALMKQKGITMPIYSDSVSGQAWVRNKKAKTTLALNAETAQVLNLVERAEKWLRENDFRVPILKWDTEKWGEIPADFGRK